ncbi:hypothetical protein V3C99_010250, partial [Haemonchus contortus]
IINETVRNSSASGHILCCISTTRSPPSSSTSSTSTRKDGIRWSPIRFRLWLNLRVVGAKNCRSMSPMLHTFPYTTSFIVDSVVWLVSANSA